MVLSLRWGWAVDNFRSDRLDIIGDQPGVLSHRPFPFSARTLDGFWRRWLTPETARWTDHVVVSPPTFRHDLCFLEGVEPRAV
jgi:hypothetical protein